MKIRDFPENNYKAIFTDSGRTLHLKYDKTAPIIELEYPEILDVAINNRCLANCGYCYINALKSGKNYEGIVEKAERFWGSLPENKRPFQIAIGGAGEPTLHPDLKAFLQKCLTLGIMPNLTTNGMHLTDSMLDTLTLCGGVALSTHPHLEKIWQKGIEKLTAKGIRTNLHIIINSKEQVDKFLTLRKEYQGLIEYFVLLPYQTVGRAKVEPTLQVTYDYLFSQLNGDERDVAWGAGFYSQLVRQPKIKVGLYDHGVLAKYLDMDNMNLYRSSYEWNTPLVENVLG